MTKKGTRGESHQLILDYIAQHPGVTSTEIITWSGMVDTTVRSILTRMKNRDHEVNLRDGGYYVIDRRTAAPADLTGNEKHEPMTFADKQRTPYPVDVYQNPVHEEAVIDIILYPDGGQPLHYPVWGGIKISLGPDDPCWQNEVSNRGIVKVKLRRQDGTIWEKLTDRGAVIAIAPL